MRNRLFPILALPFVFLACSTGAADSPGAATGDPGAPADHQEGDGGAPTPDGGRPPPSEEANTPCGKGGKLCALAETCKTHADCASNGCSYEGKCIERPSCVHHLGGNTCGTGEVGDTTSFHESCCESTEVIGFVDGAHPGKKVLLDRYEITAGRMRAFIEAMTAKYNGAPDLKSFAAEKTPAIWNLAWNGFLSSSFSDSSITIDRMLYGDPRHLGDTQAEAGPGVILVPDQNPVVSLGINTQFSGRPYVELHGENCGVYAGSYGFPTYYFPPDVQKLNGEVARVDAKGFGGEIITAQEWLDVKSMNCATQEMWQLFCSWDTGGQGSLMTTEVFEYITQTPVNRKPEQAGCGIQIDNHGNILGENYNGTIQTGGRCPDASSINWTWDAGDHLGVAAMNTHRYHYPDIDPDATHMNTDDKTWQVSAPGRIAADFIALPGQTQGWYDLAGNLSESTLETTNGNFTSNFRNRGRGIGSGSLHSDEAVYLMPGETIIRSARPEAKSALLGARCVSFR